MKQSNKYDNYLVSQESTNQQFIRKDCGFDQKFRNLMEFDMIYEWFYNEVLVLLLNESIQGDA